jgi:Tfp pilus assembly protein PilF
LYGDHSGGHVDMSEYQSIQANSSVEPTGGGVKRMLLAIAGIATLCGAIAFIYGRTLDAPFIFDDIALVELNESMRQLWPLVGTDGRDAPLTPTADTPVSGRPLVNLSFALNYHFGRFDPWGYHAVDVVLHLCCALMIWSIMRHTLRLEAFQGEFDSVAGLLSFAVALVWAVHPLDTEAVIYVTQRTELMMAFFYLATMAFCLRYWSSARPAARGAWLVLAVTSCALGMLSKEMMASAPAIMLLYERTFIAGSFGKALRRSWPLYLLLALTWLPLVALNWHQPRTPLAGFGMGIDAVTYWTTQCKVLLLYMRLAVWPWPLMIYYDVPLIDSISQAWPWVLAVALLAALTVWLVWRRPAVGFVPVWIVAILSPTLVVPCVGEVAAERRMYLPLAAMVAVAVVGLTLAIQYLARRSSPPSPRGQRIAIAACMAAVLLTSGVYAVVAASRAELYQDEMALWLDALPHQPEAPLIHINLGMFLAQRGHTSEAMEHLRTALALKPDSYEAHYNLARALEDENRPREAITHYREALRLEPRHVPSLTNFGRMLEYFDKTDEAIEQYEQAVHLSPGYGPARHNLGSTLLARGEARAAIPHLERALRFKETVETCTNLATAYALAGRSKDAIAMAHRGADLARAQGDMQLAERIEAAIEQFRTENP